jgi:hypothetical protein
MRRILFVAAAATAVAAFVMFAPGASATILNCAEPGTLCTETLDPIGYGGDYVGHDEPSLLFYSNRAGSGNSNVYQLTLPSDPKVQPNQAGTAGTWNFQLHPAFWVGMALCDTQSFPEYTSTCTANSDANIFDGSNPANADYIGKHPGTAFLELQFYPPGWVPWPPGNSCDATKWCAAMAIFSLSQNANNGAVNNADCLNTVGIEPANFAFVTKSGSPHDSPSPLGLTLNSFTPNAATDLFMNSGDRLVLDIHDSPAGLVTSIRDVTAHTSGFMVASVANGFAQVNFQPASASCTETPYAFHPMYSTSSEHTRVPWAAHSYNIAFSDEIGHFEYCNAADPSTGACTTAGVTDPGGPDGDDFGCFNPSDSLLVQIGGCIATDFDFDGTSYQKVWPGTGPNRGQDKKYHPSAIRFTSPLFNGTRNYSRVAFEADLPRIEDQTSPPCQRHISNPADPNPGQDCVNPPVGANFYPIFSTGSRGKGDGSDSTASNDNESKGCVWQFGGTNIKGTTNTFGGTSTAEFGPLLASAYPAAGNVPTFRYNNFRNVLNSNPCRAGED